MACRKSLIFSTAHLISYLKEFFKICGGTKLESVCRDFKNSWWITINLINYLKIEVHKRNKAASILTCLDSLDCF